jgi:hypothetical protein
MSTRPLQTREPVQSGARASRPVRHVVCLDAVNALERDPYPLMPGSGGSIVR